MADDVDVEVKVTGGDEAAVPVPVRVDFVIDSESKASWAVGKLLAVDEEIVRVKAQASQRLAELAADKRELEGRFLIPLRMWAEGEAARRRRKTVTLIGGSLSFRSVPAGLKVADPVKAEAAAREAGLADCFETVEKFKPGIFQELAQRRLEEIGELLEGVEQVEAHESFSVKAAKPKAKGGEAERDDSDV